MLFTKMHFQHAAGGGLDRGQRANREVRDVKGPSEDQEPESYSDKRREDQGF